MCAFELMLGRRPFEGRTAEGLTNALVKDVVRVPERASGLGSQEGIAAVKQVSRIRLLFCSEGMLKTRSVA